MERDADKTPIILNMNMENEFDVHIPEASTHLSVTTVLNYCKCKILHPYQRLLSVMGLRSLLNEQQEPNVCLNISNYAYTLQAVSFLVIGYVLQYMACFRRDKGFWYTTKIETDDLYAYKKLQVIYIQTCERPILFTTVIPSVLHLAGYLHAVYVFRCGDDEQLPILMERVFLLSTHLTNSFVTQKKLVRTLWLFVFCSMVWMSSSFIMVVYLMTSGEVNFKWMDQDPIWIVIMMKIILVMCTLVHDMVQATIISNYCLQAQLLTSYAQFLREKLLQHSVIPLEWMRDIEDYKKLLNYFNKKISVSVCLLIVVNISFLLCGVVWLLNFSETRKENLPFYSLIIPNVLLWSFISVSPFIQAARLSNACEILKTVGQEARTRPYVHLDTPTIELDSVLLYTTSLEINAKLFLVPITGRTLCVCTTIAMIIILVLGQCNFLMQE